MNLFQGRKESFLFSSFLSYTSCYSKVALLTSAPVNTARRADRSWLMLTGTGGAQADVSGPLKMKAPHTHRETERPHMTRVGIRTNLKCPESKGKEKDP